MAALGWLLNLDFAGSGASAPAPSDVIARSRMLHFAHHAVLGALIVGASQWS